MAKTLTTSNGQKIKIKNYKTEDDFQIACIRYMQYMHPKVICIHTPNGGFRNKREAGKFKRMGVVRGIPDILIFKAKGGYHGLAIELKINNNRVSPEQKKMLQRLKDEDWKTEVLWDSLDDFIYVVDDYLGKTL